MLTKAYREFHTQIRIFVFIPARIVQAGVIRNHLIGI